jgi:hypothetical protein
MRLGLEFPTPNFAAVPNKFYSFSCLQNRSRFLPPKEGEPSSVLTLNPNPRPFLTKKKKLFFASEWKAALLR